MLFGRAQSTDTEQNRMMKAKKLRATQENGPRSCAKDLRLQGMCWEHNKMARDHAHEICALQEYWLI